MKIVKDDSGLIGVPQPNTIDLPQRAATAGNVVTPKPAILPDDSGLQGSPQTMDAITRMLDNEANTPVDTGLETVAAVPVHKPFGVFVNRRVSTSTTIPAIVTFDLECRYVTVHADTDTYIQLGTSIDQIGSLLIHTHTAIRLPLQHNRSITLLAVTAPGHCYITFHDENIDLYTAKLA